MSIDLKLQSTTGDFNKGQHTVVFDSLGRLQTVKKGGKLIQDILKLFNTTINNFYEKYKTDIQDIIGTAQSKDATVNLIAYRLTDALVYLQYLQQQQARYQQVDGSEIIKSIDQINVDWLFDITHDENDVRTFRCQVMLTDALGNQVTAAQDVTAA